MLHKRLSHTHLLHAQADDGYLYPLERAFFYVHKPPTLLVHDEVESVEFLRQGGGVLAASAKTFDLNIRLKNDTVRRTPPVPGLALFPEAESDLLCGRADQCSGRDSGALPLRGQHFLPMGFKALGNGASEQRSLDQVHTSSIRIYTRIQGMWVPSH